MHFAKFPELVLALSLALLTSAHTAKTLADGKLDHIGQQVRRDAPSLPPSTGLEAFPGRPVVVAFEGSAGLLGKAFAAALYGRIGLMLGPFEVSAGWHQRWIAETPLGGPFLAIRFWL